MVRLMSGTGRLIAGLLAILIVVVLVFGIFIGLQFVLVPVALTTTSTTNTGRNWVGAGGGFPGGEMLDQTTYIASWSDDLDGQKVTMQGKHAESFGTQCILDGVRYLVDINEGGGWVRVEERVFSGFFGGTSPVSGPIHQYRLHGIIPSGAGVRVQYDGHCAGAEPVGGWIPFVHDEARIVSGIGNVEWEENQYTVGETAIVRWEIPYVTDEASKTGWSLFVHSTASDLVVGPIKLNTTFGSYRYSVTSADFAVQSDCRNELVAILRNELWDKDFDTTTIIDVSGLAPSVQITGWTPLAPEQGDLVTVRFDASKNAESDLELTKFIAKYGYGGVDKEIVLGPEAREFTFAAGAAGTVHVEVIAYDSGCRPSPTSEADIKIGEPGPELGGLSLLAILALVLAAISGVILAVAVPAPRVVKFALFLAPLAGVLALIVVGFL